MPVKIPLAQVDYPEKGDIMKISRLFLVILCIVLVLGSRKESSSAEFSCSSLKLVVPYSPGGRSDTVARIWQKISQKYMRNINIVVQNRPGGGGVLGTGYVKNSAADGCTLLVATITNLIIRAIKGSSLLLAHYRKGG